MATPSRLVNHLRSRWDETWRWLDARTAPLREEERFPGRTLFVWAALLVASWYFGAPWLHSGTRLSEADYGGSVLLWPLLSSKRMVVFVLIFTAVLIGGWQRLAWNTFAEGRKLRLFALVVAAVLAWGAAFAPYNLFFDQAHALERLLTLLFVALIWVHPGFVPFALILMMTLFHELRHPLGVFTWTDKRVVFDSLIVFSFFLPLRLVLGKVSSRPYIFVVLCMLAAWYYEAGLAKWQLDWHEHDELSFLLAVSTDNGWLPGLSEEALRRLVEVTAALNPLLVWVTLIMEFGAIAVLAVRRSPPLFCICWAVLHVAIFAASGIFFWKWIVLNLALLLVLGSLDFHPRNRWSRAFIFVLSVALIHNTWIWRPVALGWYDTPFSPVFRMTAVGLSGMRYEVAPSYLAPYDITFAQGRFAYLDETRPLVGTYGATLDLATLKAAKAGLQELEKHRTKRPLSAQDRARREAYDRLIREFFGHLNAHLASSGERPRWAGWLRSPMHIWTFPVGPRPYRGQEPVNRIEVRLEESYYDGARKHVFSDRLVHQIEIPGAR